MSAEGPRRAGDRPQVTDLASLGVNLGRMHRQDEPAIAAEAAAYRVVIDVHVDGDFTVYSDLDVQVICRCAHIAEDEMVQIGHRPIPERWLTRTVGYRGDGSVADLLSEVIETWTT
jgi:hypothetical protein